jgi:ribosomal protein L29
MNTKELRTQSPKRLRELLDKAAAAVRDLRFTVSTRQQAHVRDLRKAKRELARIKTVLREAERKEQSPSAEAPASAHLTAPGAPADKTGDNKGEKK